MPVRPFPKGVGQKERTAEVVDVTGRGEGGGRRRAAGNEDTGHLGLAWVDAQPAG